MIQLKGINKTYFNGAPLHVLKGIDLDIENPAATEQPTQTTAPAQATQNSTSSEYDNVPKTGENSAMFWLLGAAVVCMTGGYTIRRKNVQEAK